MLRLEANMVLSSYGIGKIEGIREGIINTAINLLKKGIELEVISKANGLNEEDIFSLKKLK